MSVSIGIYDLFAYTIPGFLCLYVINEFFKVIGWEPFQFNQIKDGNALIFATTAVICLYVAGHLFDYFANWFCFHLLTRYKIQDANLNNLKKRYPQLNIKFETNDWNPLFAILRQRHLDYSHVIDTFGANNILLRNVCLSLFLLSLLYVKMLILDFSWATLIVVLGMLILSWVAFHRSRMFYFWFFSDIYNASLEYGTTLKEVVEYNREKKSPKRRKRKTNA